MNKNKLILSIGLLLMGCQTNSQVSLEDNNRNLMVDYFSDNGFGNAVAIVQHPAGVYHNGVTYVCYQGPLEDPYVASYDHKTEVWEGPFKAGVSEMGKDPNRKKKIDNHGKPSIIIDDDGYIHIAFGGHGGMRKHGENTLGNHHYGKNLHAVSKKPLDISSWETLNNIPPFGTYNQFVKMDNGDIYLFYRHGAHRSNWVYQKSIDHGRTFEAPVSFLKHKRRSDQAAEDSWYPWITKGEGDDLLVVFDYHLCSDKTATVNQLGHVPKRYNIYYMIFNTKTGVWRNVKGTSLTMPLIREEADEKALVATTDGKWTFQGTVALDLDGNPHIGMTIGNEREGKSRSAPKHLEHFRWDGTEWIHNKNSGLPIGNGDLEVESQNNINVYVEDELGSVSVYKSFDSGKGFKKSKVLLRRRNARFAISSLIDNAHPHARIVVAEKEAETDFRKMYLLGDKGPIKRSKKGAAVLEH